MFKHRRQVLVKEKITNLIQVFFQKRVIILNIHSQFKYTVSLRSCFSVSGSLPGALRSIWTMFHW